MAKKIILLFCSTALLLCSRQSLVAGGGSEGEARNASVAGRVFYPGNGKPASNAVVILRPSTFLAVSISGTKPVSIQDTTDADGRFRVDSIDTGDYTLEINDKLGSAVLFQAKIPRKDTLVWVGVDTLRLTGTLRGIVETPAHSGSFSAHVQVYGLDRNARIDSAGEYALTDIPKGTFTVRISPDSGTGYQARDSSGISLSAGTTLDIGAIILYSFSSESYSSWQFSDTIAINTSVSGAAVFSTQTGVPLLVRLDSMSPVFGRAADLLHGDDIRFAKIDGSHLTYQIERWDPVLKHAEIWVALDTVKGNDSSDCLVMYSGKTGVSSWSDGSKVFSRQAGFAAVWHLGASLHDATGNGNEGTGIGTTVTDGVIGQACAFNGSATVSIDSSTSLDMANRSVSVLVWQKSGGTYSSERMFFEHGIWPGAGDYGFSTVNDRALSFDFPSANSEVRSLDSLVNDNRWHMEAISFNNATDTGIIYHDGRAIKADTVRSEISSGPCRSFIGSRGGTERFFTGAIDEVWICARPISPDYVKLMYENQREDQTVLKIR